MDFKIELIILIVALILVLRGIDFSVSSLVGIIFNRRKQHWVTKHFKNNSNVDCKRVFAFVEEEGNPPEDFTAWEMVAVFGLILSDSTVYETLRIARTWGDLGWDKKYNYDFFTVLEQTAQNILWKYRGKVSIRLFQFGQRLAQQYDNNFWEARFKEKIEQVYNNINAQKWDSSRQVGP